MTVSTTTRKTALTKEITNQKKATDQQIIDAYSELKSVWLVADKLGMCGQTVHGRLQKIGIDTSKPDEFTEEQIVLITRFYTERAFTRRGDFSLDDLATLLGKSKHNICRKAKRLGLTNMKRKMSKELIDNLSEKMIGWHKENEHPKGFLGKKHTEEVKKNQSVLSLKIWQENEELISGRATFRGLKTKHENGTLLRPRTGVSWKGGIRKIGDIEKYFRSSWEANYARVLQILLESKKIYKWEHEPDTYWFENISRGSRCYTPDFKIWVSDKEFYYVEIKGWMDQKSETKLARMKKYYPEHKIVVLKSTEMKEIKKIYQNIVDIWE